MVPGCSVDATMMLSYLHPGTGLIVIPSCPTHAAIIRATAKT